jgi:transposase
VITMEMLGKIRRMHLRDGLSLHEITKLTGLSRNTIRRWLRSSEKAAPPTYRRHEGPGKLSATDPGTRTRHWSTGSSS